MKEKKPPSAPVRVGETQAVLTMRVEAPGTPRAKKPQVDGGSKLREQGVAGRRQAEELEGDGRAI